MQSKCVICIIDAHFEPSSRDNFAAVAVENEHSIRIGMGITLVCSPTKNRRAEPALMTVVHCAIEALENGIENSTNVTNIELWPKKCWAVRWSKAKLFTTKTITNEITSRAILK